MLKTFLYTQSARHNGLISLLGIHHLFAINDSPVLFVTVRSNTARSSVKFFQVVFVMGAFHGGDC